MASLLLQISKIGNCETKRKIKNENLKACFRGVKTENFSNNFFLRLLYFKTPDKL